jgi:uncharacterized repeat protein (TIGR02543 family)
MKRKKIILLALLLFLAVTNSFAQMQIFVRQSESMPRYVGGGATTLTLDCDSSDSVENIKQRINEKLSLVPVGNLMLIFAGTILEDGRTLADYNIQKESTVHVYAVNLYPATAVEVGGTTSLLSMAAPGADYSNKTVGTTPGFTGTLSLLPSGEVSIENAAPAGTYVIQINISGGSPFQSFTLTVYNSSYTVLFNANGGTGTLAVQPIDSNTSANLKPNTFTRTGYVFAGWNTAANGSGTSYANGASYTMSAAPNVTLYAQWTAINYTVTFDANGGTGTMSDQTIAFNASANLTSNAFTRWGYTFAGWNGNYTSYADQASYTMSTAANVYLQAQWQLLQPPGSSSQIFVRQSDSMPRYAGGIGTTIFMDVDSDNTIAQIRHYLADLTLVPFENLGLFFAGNILEDSRTLAYYNIQYESQIHVFAVHLYPDTSVVTGDTASVLSVAAPGDNYFSKTVSTTHDFTGSLSVLPSGEISIQNASPAGTYEIQINNDYGTLFQKFILTVKNNYTVTFDVNGGTGTMATQTITSEASANLRINAFTRTGYAFTGWATTSGGTVAYANSANYTMGDADVSLYAKWTIADSQSFCKGATVAAAGSGLKFYTALTGGSPLSGTTALTTKTYYVTETNNSGPSARVPVAVTVNALPATPTLLVLTNVNSATPDSAIKAVGVYVGAEAALKLTATAVGATSYVWTLPAGVTLVDGFTTGTVTTQLNTIDIKFSASAATSSLVLSVKSVNASGCSSSLAKTLTLTRAIPVAPANLKMNNGLNTTAITSFAKYMGTDTILRLSAATSATATSYVWELPEGVNRVTAVNDLTVINSLETTVPEIFVTLTGVNSGNTHNYLTSATVPVSTNVLRIGVYGKNGTGLSTTVNATLANPATESAARLLTLTAVKPAAPATLKMYDLNSLTPATAVTAITTYVNTESELKLEAKASALASSYTWYLQEGVNVTNNTATAVEGAVNTYKSTSNSITVNFYGVPHEQEAFSLVLGVRAVNGVGESLSTNAAPNASKTDKLLTLTASLPTVPGTVSGSLKICATTASSVTYTIAAVAAKAVDYLIEVPSNCTITDNEGTYGSSQTIAAVANASFTVNYPAGFVVTSANPKTITIKSANNVGLSATNKVLTLTNTGAVCTPAPGRIAAEATTADKFSVVAYPNPATEGFRVKSSSGKSIGVQVYDMLGRSIEQRQLQSEDQIGSNYAKGIYNVIVSQGTEVKTLRVIKQ